MATQDGTGEQAGTTCTSSVTVFLPTLLFSSSHFYHLFCRELYIATDEAGPSGMGQVATTRAATATRDGARGRRAGGGVTIGEGRETD